MPLEQTALAQTVDPKRRTALFARYSLTGTFVAAIGTLAAAIPELAAAHLGIPLLSMLQVMFGVYGAIGITAFLLYRRLTPAVEAPTVAPQAALHRSRRIVYGLAALFSLDSFGGGFVVQSLVALWLFQNFGLSVTTTASILFWASLCAAASSLLAVPLAERIGLIRTMVFTHLPANVFLMLVPFAPNLTTAIALLLARSSLSHMDVPTRNSYVMAVVAPEERPAAASLTLVPRSFAASLSPMLAGYLLSATTFGWPLLIGGALKIVYDLLLLSNFRRVRPPEEAEN